MGGRNPICTPAGRVLRSRSRDLLERLIAGGEIDADGICRELSLSGKDLDDLLTGTRTMSLPVQLCFAKLLIERVPRLAQRGRTLRDQVLAAMAYSTGTTTVHASQPLKWSSLKARRN
jgi:hypothetical protein